MNIVIPPLFFYAIGVVLLVAGVVRAVTLGRRRPERGWRPNTAGRPQPRRRRPGRRPGGDQR